MIMSDTVKIAIVLASLALSFAAPSFAAPAHHIQDPWVQPIHHDSNAVPAKEYFQETERDGK
jgi:hypothetical protein